MVIPLDFVIEHVHDYIVLLGDFGAAIQQARHGLKFGKSFGMPGEWASPEWPEFSFASDIWLVGSVVQECCRFCCKSRLVCRARPKTPETRLVSGGGETRLVPLKAVRLCRRS